MEKYDLTNIDLPLLKEQIIMLSEMIADQPSSNELWGVVGLLEDMTDHIEGYNA
jgi:hypothetical protein